MADQDRAVTKSDLFETLEAMQQLDEILGRILPTGGIDLEGQAQVLATEYLVIARRTFGTIRLIMGWTIVLGETDCTEDAAVLMRRIYELYARVAFIVSESSDHDGNALRIELDVERESEKAMRDIPEESRDSSHAERHEQCKARIEAIKRELEARFVEAKPVPRMYDIFKKIAPERVLLWRHVSDVAHANAVGRSLQRVENTLGTPASPERMRDIMDWSNMAMGDLARCWARIMGRDLTELEAFGDAHNLRIGAASDQADSDHRTEPLARSTYDEAGEQVFSVLEGEPIPRDGTWTEWIEANKSKMRSRNPVALAEVIRDFSRNPEGPWLQLQSLRSKAVAELASRLRPIPDLTKDQIIEQIYAAAGGEREYELLLRKMKSHIKQRSQALEDFFDNASADMTGDELYQSWIRRAGPKSNLQSAKLEVDTIRLAWGREISVEPAVDPIAVPDWETRRVRLQAEGEAEERAWREVVSHPEGNREAPTGELASVGDTDVETWSTCLECHGELLSRVPAAVQCVPCNIVYTNKGVQPQVSTEPSTYGLVIGTESWNPIMPSQLSRLDHPLIWAVRPNGVSEEFPLILAHLELEERAFGTEP